MSAALTAYDSPFVHTRAPGATQSLLLRVLDKPAVNEVEPQTGDGVRLRVFDRFRLFTHRLAFFRMQTRPVGSNGRLVPA